MTAADIAHALGDARREGRAWALGRGRCLASHAAHSQLKGDQPWEAAYPMRPHVPKPGAGNTGPRGVRIADSGYVSPIAPQCMPVDKIRVGKRHRKEMGDLNGLAASMHASGLLHLLCGERRVAAAKLIRWKTILVRRLTSFTNEVPAAGLATHTAGKFFNCVEGQLWSMKSRNPSSKS